MYIVPVPPSRVTLCPVRRRFVASLTAVTAGMRYSRDITAPWQRMPPVSVTRPPSLAKAAVHPGSVLLVTRISPFCTSDSLEMSSTTLTVPVTVPGLDAAPVMVPTLSPASSGSSKSTPSLRNFGGSVSLYLSKSAILRRRAAGSGTGVPSLSIPRASDSSRKKMSSVRLSLPSATKRLAISRKILLCLRRMWSR